MYTCLSQYIILETSEVNKHNGK